MFQLTADSKEKEFLLRTQANMIQIKKMIVTPLFNWTKPDEWFNRLQQQALGFKITVFTSRGESFSQPIFFSALTHPSMYKSVFNYTIEIPHEFNWKKINLNDYPLRIVIELTSSVPQIDFDVMFVYDSILD